MTKRRARSDDEKRALRQVEQAREAYTTSEQRVTDLRERLARAETKLTRRAERLSEAERVLALHAAAVEVSPASGRKGKRAPATDALPDGDLVASASAQTGDPIATINLTAPETPEQTVDVLEALVVETVKKDTPTSPRARSRRKKPALDGA